MSFDNSKYYKRKALGVCVRCEAPQFGGSVLCEAHLNYSRSRRKAKCPDDAPESLPAPIPPPRDAYKSESVPVMPPTPDQCPRCRNIVMTIEGDSFCYACGWHLQPVLVPFEPEQRGRRAGPGKTGAQLPIVVRV